MKTLCTTALLLILFLPAACDSGGGTGGATDTVGDPSQSNTSCGPASGVVDYVVDGDTVELSDGTRIRYIGVDTPETYGEVECYGPEAKAYNVERVEGREVVLEYDERCTDRYDRLLAYVYVDGHMVNMELLERGLGSLLIIPPCDRYEDAMAQAEALAQDYDRGLWGVCD